MNEVTKGKWQEIKGELRKAWAKITDDEWEKTKGDIQAIGGLVRQRYGEVEKDLSQHISNIFQMYVSKPTHEALKKDNEVPSESLSDEKPTANH